MKPADQTRNELREHIRRLVDEAPPLTEEQRARLAVLFRPAAAAKPARRAAA